MSVKEELKKLADAALHSAADTAMSTAQEEASKKVAKIVVDTTMLPQIVIDKPFEESKTVDGKPAPPTFMERLKIKATAFDPKGKQLYRYMPNGEPGPTRWPKYRNGAVVGFLALLGITFGLGRLSKKR